MNKFLREKAIRMRVEEQMSYTAISTALKVPKSTLSYWLHEYPLSEEKILALRRAGWEKGEASRERYRNTMRKKREEKDDEEYKKWYAYLGALTERDIMIAGLILYLGEGAKRKEGQLVLANTDPEVIKFFLFWLETFLKVPRSDVRIQLHLYESMKLDKEHDFWQNTLKVQRSQFYKCSVRALKPHSFVYSATHGHGTCSLYAFGVDRRRVVQMATKAFLNLSNKHMRV